MSDKSVLAILIFIVCFAAPVAHAGRMELTTYYPAPVGEYRNLNSTEDSNFATTSGNVGIGTASPNDKVHVLDTNDGLMPANVHGAVLRLESNGTNHRQTGLVIQNPAQYWALVSTQNGTAGPLPVPSSLSFWHIADPTIPGGTFAMTLTANNWVGIGTTTPRTSLDVVGGIRAQTGVPTVPDVSMSGFAFGPDGDTGMFRVDSNLASPNPVAFGDLVFFTDLIEVMRVTHSQRVGIGTNNPAERLDVAGNIRHTGTCAASDRRWKKNIEPLSGSLEKIEQLQGVSFEWRADEFKDQGFKNGRQIGLIAQDVEKIVPEMVSTDESSEGYKSVSYERAVPLLIEAVKEQQKEIESLKGESKAQQEAIESLKEEIGSRKGR